MTLLRTLETQESLLSMSLLCSLLSLFSLMQTSFLHVLCNVVPHSFGHTEIHLTFSTLDPNILGKSLIGSVWSGPSLDQSMSVKGQDC